MIQRLMGEVSGLKQSLELSQESRGQLHARSAAPGAAQIARAEEQAPVPVRQSVQPVVSETSNSNQSNLDAIQSLSVQMAGLPSRVDDFEQGRQSSSAHLHNQNGAGGLSRSSKELPI